MNAIVHWWFWNLDLGFFAQYLQLKDKQKSQLLFLPILLLNGLQCSYAKICQSMVNYMKVMMIEATPFKLSLQSEEKLLARWRRNSCQASSRPLSVYTPKYKNIIIIIQSVYPTQNFFMAAPMLPTPLYSFRGIHRIFRRGGDCILILSTLWGVSGEFFLLSVSVAHKKCRNSTDWGFVARFVLPCVAVHHVPWKRTARATGMSLSFLYY